MKKKIAVIVALLLFAAVPAACGEEDKPVVYTVTFDANGGQSAPAPLSDVEKGAKITAPETDGMSRSGYDFDGKWYKDAACLGEWDFSVDTVEKNETLYAGWIDPYRVMTAEQLAGIELDGDYKLGADLSLDGFVPLGSAGEPFTGSIDGNGFEITALSIDLSGMEADGNGDIYAGIFAVNKGVIKNLEVRNAVVEGANATEGATVYAGVIAGQNDGTIESCGVSGAVGLDAAGGDTKYRSGFIAAKNTGAISRCAVSGEIVADLASGNSRIGGITGNSDGGSIVECAAEADIDSESTSGNILAGGIAGTLAEADTVVSKCYSGGTVTVKGESATVYAGGLVGYLDSTDDAGKPAFYVSDSYAAGAANAETGGNAYAGGLIARIENAGYTCAITVERCYSSGAVQNDASGGNVFAGGVIGRIQWTSGSAIDIEKCFTLSEAVCEKSDGVTSAIKNNANSGTVTDCFFDGELVYTDTYSGTAAARSELLSSAWRETNLGWDFENLWTANDGAPPALSGLPAIPD